MDVKQLCEKKIGGRKNKESADQYFFSTTNIFIISTSFN